MSTAQVLFQRFWFVTSLKHFGIRVTLTTFAKLLTSSHLSSTLCESDSRVSAIIEYRTLEWELCSSLRNWKNHQSDYETSSIPIPTFSPSLPTPQLSPFPPVPTRPPRTTLPTFQWTISRPSSTTSKILSSSQRCKS